MSIKCVAAGNSYVHVDRRRWFGWLIAEVPLHTLQTMAVGPTWSAFVWQTMSSGVDAFEKALAAVTTKYGVIGGAVTTVVLGEEDRHYHTGLACLSPSRFVTPWSFEPTISKSCCSLQ
jgi:hypothetical protein